MRYPAQTKTHAEWNLIELISRLQYGADLFSVRVVDPTLTALIHDARNVLAQSADISDYRVYRIYGSIQLSGHRIL